MSNVFLDTWWRRGVVHVMLAQGSSVQQKNMLANLSVTSLQLAQTDRSLSSVWFNLRLRGGEEELWNSAVQSATPTHIFPRYYLDKMKQNMGKRTAVEEWSICHMMYDLCSWTTL